MFDDGKVGERDMAFEHFVSCSAVVSSAKLHHERQRETYSGSTTGGQSFNACTNTGRVISGEVTTRMSEERY